MLNALANCSLFYSLPQEFLANVLLGLGAIREYSRGSYLLTPQESVNRLGVVIHGRVQILHVFEDGNYSLSSVLERGDVLGADLICTRSRMCPYYVKADTPVHIIYFPAEIFLADGHLPEQHRQYILEKLLMLISHDNIKKEYRLAILSRKGLRERIITYLHMQSSKRNSKTITVPFSRDEMASYLCVNRSALSHELSLMQKEGLITFRKNVFHLLNPELFAELYKES